MTKDERFLVEMYRKMSESGETIDPYQVGKGLGYNDHLITNILKMLMQANLVKRYDPHSVALTVRGQEVARSMAKSK